MSRRAMLRLGLLLTTAALAGCGRQGPLRLPDEAARPEAPADLPADEAERP